MGYIQQGREHRGACQAARARSGTALPARRRFLSLTGSLCPLNPVCPQFTSSPEMWGGAAGPEGGREALWGGAELLPSRMGCTRTARGSPASPCRLLCAGLHVICCRTKFSSPHPADGQPPPRKVATSQAKDLHSERKYASTNSKPVRAKPQHWDGEGEPPQSPSSQAALLQT